jgi:broad specificity phosphatase PhoE
MLKFFFLILFITIANVSQAQITTFIVVRHAEKMADGSKNPELSPEGKKRADALAKILNKLEINKIYSTNYARTQQTVQPIAQAKGLTINEYEAKPQAAFFQKLLQENEGKTVLIVGHSNTVNEILNILTQTQKYKPLEDSEYQHIFIVAKAKNGDAQVLNWNYGF